MTTITCPHCRKRAKKESGAVNRARKNGCPVYCSRRCSGLARRVKRSRAERRRLKAEYDANRRVALADVIREKKREYFQRTYTPEKGRAYRKHRTFDHTAYCRRYYADPARKAAKVEYDKWRRAERQAGEYAECMVLLNELRKEIIKQMPDKYERMKARGYYDNQRESHNERRRQDAA